MTALSELVAELALLGVMFIVIMLLLYGVLLGYIMSRLPKMDRQLIHRALMAQPLSQDPLMAKRERRLIKAMEVME